MNKPKIIVAPLNWGIGHATRCVPLINDLILKGFDPIITSDGNALTYLKKEFPNLKTYELPSYKIEYAKKGYLLKLKLLFQIPRIQKAIKEEHEIIQDIVEIEEVKGIISDNRFGVYSSQITSIYITHQLRVLSGISTFFTTKIHQEVMANFQEIWVPDFKKSPRLSGILSVNSDIKIPIKFIGILSRFSHKGPVTTKQNIDILVLLSGMEPQRRILEKKLIATLKKSSKKIVFIRGVLSSKTLKNTTHITFINFLSQDELFVKITQSKLVIARSGYSTLMDLAALQKKAFLIPTPGQTEQEYLAKHLDTLKITPFSTQKKLHINLNANDYSGFTDRVETLDLSYDIFKYSKEKRDRLRQKHKTAFRDIQTKNRVLYFISILVAIPLFFYLAWLLLSHIKF